MRLITKILLILVTFFALPASAQDIKSTLQKATYPGIQPLQADSIKHAIIDSVFENPALYNDAYAKFLNSYKSDSSQLFKFLRDLNFKFKTFQSTTQPAALGFEYDYENNWTKSQTKAASSSFQTLSVKFTGNVAFNNTYNTSNLLESSAKYNASFLWGGSVMKLDSAGKAQYLRLQQAIIAANIARNMPLLKNLYVQLGALNKVTNQYYVGINGNFSVENTQDFKRSQYVPGALLNLGAKPWNPKQALLYFNIPDYPFALIRLITGTDDSFKLSAASFPSVLLGLDHVIPNQDAVRESVAGNINPYNRVRGEVAFKTKMAYIGGQMVFFSADLRLYRELAPSAAIQSAGLNKFTFFAASIEATKGFFISYTTGQLPFDLQSNNVYGIGYHYYLGNW